MKKILISTIAIVMAISMVFVFNDTSSAESTSGECGENLTWTYDPDTTTLTISGEGTAIQDYASAGSPWHDLNVTNVVFDCPNLTTIGAYAFEDSNMSNHKLPYKITTINEGAFRNCYMLALEKLPDKLTTIGNGAFEHCIRLNIMTIPYGVTVLGPNVFKDCMGIHVMIVPSSITSIDNTAFEDTTGLTTVGNLSTVDITDKFPYKTHELVVTGSGTCHTSGSNILRYTWFSEIDTLYIAGIGNAMNNSWSAVENVPWYSYQGEIESVVFNTPYLLSIGKYSFRNCTNLTTIIFPDTLQTINTYTFAGCTNLVELNFPDSIITISANSFTGCTSLIEVTIPENVTAMPGCFQNCTNLKTVYYNAINCTSFKAGAYGSYYGCSNLETLVIGENVRQINTYYMFDGPFKKLYYNAVAELDISSDVVSFTNTQIREIIIGDKVTHIPSYFAKRSSIGTNGYLQSVSFNENIKSIGDHAFESCTNMVVLSIPESVESIGTSAFAGCSNVMIRSLPEGVHLNPTAFQNCTGITSLVLPGEIGFGSNCFEGCTNLKQILNLSDMEIVAGSDNHGKVGYYADSVQDHIDGVAIVQDKEHVQHETVMDDSLTSKLLRFVPVFVSLGLLLGAIAYMYVRRNDY